MVVLPARVARLTSLRSFWVFLDSWCSTLLMERTAAWRTFSRPPGLPAYTIRLITSSP